VKCANDAEMANWRRLRHGRGESVRSQLCWLWSLGMSAGFGNGQHDGCIEEKWCASVTLGVTYGEGASRSAFLWLRQLELSEP